MPSAMKRVGLYAGSFDPMTNGHLAMLNAAFGLFDSVIVAIGVHPSKAPLFSPSERRDLILLAAGPIAAKAGATLEVKTFDTLLVHFARDVGAHALIRGLRDGTDLDYEMQLAGMNGSMAPEVQTIFFPAEPKDRHITSTLVRQIAAMGGDIKPFVPPVVAKALKAKFAKKR
jgi:pantetheine-phosphate adenylyltransferase